MNLDTATPGDAKAAFAPQIDRGSAVPLYAQVQRSVQAEILRRHLRPGDRFPSENELSRTLGLSRSTVARAVTQLATDGVLTRRKGFGTFVGRIDRLGSEQTQGSIVCVFSRFLGRESIEEFFLPIVHSVERAIHDYGHRCSLMSYEDADGKIDSLFKGIGMGHYSGVVLLSQDDEFTERLMVYSVPTVAVAPLDPQLRVPSVYNDNELGSQIGLDFLSGLGRKKIGVIGGPVGTPGAEPSRSSNERIVGAHNWIRRNGAGIEFAKMEISTYDPVTRKREIRQFIEAHGDLDAVFGLHDSLAIDSMSILLSMGVKIPGQVAVLGYDDTVSAARIHPALTTVAVDEEKIGEIVAKQVVEQIQGGTSVYTISRVPPHLIRREST